MSRANLMWTVLFVVGGVCLAGRAMFSEHGMGKAYLKAVPVQADHASGGWSRYTPASEREYVAEQALPAAERQIRYSPAWTLGVWTAAFLTLFVFSFIIRDNPLYKIAESIFVGVSAAYWMVVAFWAALVPNLVGKLSPDLVRAWAMPGLGAEEVIEWIYLVPLVLGVMLLWRLSPVGGWISRWPMAFIIGVFCGLRLITFIQADFLTQIRNSIVPLWVMIDGNFEFWASIRNLTLVIGILSCLVYFFFSIEHRGAVGHVARLGIWFLMITFGAAFGYTVMGRIALLAIRLEFLLDDWLWLVDPTGRRVADVVGVLMGCGLV